jgi:hypothetical protein
LSSQADCSLNICGYCYPPPVNNGRDVSRREIFYFSDYASYITKQAVYAMPAISTMKTLGRRYKLFSINKFTHGSHFLPRYFSFTIFPPLP